MRKPFYRKSRKCWFVKDDDGKFIRLDSDEETAHKIWMNMRELGKSLAHPDVSFVTLANGWLDAVENEMEPDRFVFHGRHVGQFAKWVGAKIAADITPNLVYEWLKLPRKRGSKGKAKPWSLSTQQNAASTLKRMFAWAVSSGYLSKSPIASIRLKTPKPRDRIITYEEHKQLVLDARSRDDQGKKFALYLIASRCGARPQQIREVTAANVTKDCDAWVFRHHKTAKKTGKPLFVYLTPCLRTLTLILVASRKSGPLFCQADGTAWKKDGVSRRMNRTCERLGLGGVVAYSYRHAFATQALLDDIPLATVSAMLGHKDTRMVSQVYGHLDQHQKHLVEAAAKVGRSQYKDTTS